MCWQRFANSMASGKSQRWSAGRSLRQSVAEIRMPSGLRAGHAERIASKTSSGQRIRFSSEPP